MLYCYDVELSLSGDCSRIELNILDDDLYTKKNEDGTIDYINGYLCDGGELKYEHIYSVDSNSLINLPSVPSYNGVLVYSEKKPSKYILRQYIKNLKNINKTLKTYRQSEIEFNNEIINVLESDLEEE